MKSQKTRGNSKVSRLTSIFKSSPNMTYKDIKRNCVARGLSFQEVVDGTVPRLSNWLHHHNNDEVKPELLDQFDDWVEDILRSRGAFDLIHPQLRLGFIGEKDKEGNNKKTKRIKGIPKKKRARREKTKDGIYKGTKKALTFKLQQKGRSLDRTIKKVLRIFPDASEKSIKIWYKKSARLNEKDKK